MERWKITLIAGTSLILSIVIGLASYYINYWIGIISGIIIALSVISFLIFKIAKTNTEEEDKDRISENESKTFLSNLLLTKDYADMLDSIKSEGIDMIGSGKAKNPVYHIVADGYHVKNILFVQNLKSQNYRILFRKDDELTKDWTEEEIFQIKNRLAEVPEITQMVRETYKKDEYGDQIKVIEKPKEEQKEEADDGFELGEKEEIGEKEVNG